MEFSLDDLLNEVEEAMMEKPFRTSGDGVQATIDMDWSRPPLYKKKSDPLEPQKPPSWSGVTSRRLEDIVAGSTPYTAAPSPPPITRADTDYLSGAIKKYTDADEILRAALDASKKTRSPSCGGESGEPSKSGGTYSSVSVQEASVENTPRKENCCGLLTATTKKRRCGAVRLAGTATQKGFCATSLSQSACDSLRCTDCNFEVLRFDGRSWDSATDYMFLRNNAPDLEKMGVRLQRSPDTCAYACQCSWKNEDGLLVLSPLEQPRWACGGH